MLPALLILVLAAAPQQAAAAGNLVVDEGAADTVVVCPDAFRPALAPWLDYRRGEGRRITIVSNLGSPDDIRERIRAVALGGRLRFIVLVGQARADLLRDDVLRPRCVPMHYARARVNVLWGSEPTLSSDEWYAEADDASDENPVPRFAIGRLTADSPAELRQIVAKILDYEQSRDFGAWRRQLNLVAGMGGFGPLADTVIETATRYFLSEKVPPEYCLSMTYGNWQSPYCPDPREFHRTTLDRLNEGSLFWVYLGHGYPAGLDPLAVPGRRYPTLSLSDAPSLCCRHGRPIALFLSCYAGAIDARQGCLAEMLLSAPGGPVGVLAGSRVTMPYAMTVLATGLMADCFSRRCETLGEAVLHTKQDMLKEPAAGDHGRAMLDAIAAAISPLPGQLAAERAEHVLMFNLIGDPLLRLRHPQAIALRAPPCAAPGETVVVTGDCPIAGRGTLDLLVRRDRLPCPRPVRREYPQDARELAGFQEVYRQANDRRLRSMELAVRGGAFSARLKVPDNAVGQCHVCLFVEGQTDFACGAVELCVKAATP
jgi:hypothetical protein